MDKKTVVTSGSLTKVSGIGGKTISTIEAYRHGSVDVVEVKCTDSTVAFFKFTQAGVEVGGTNEAGTGTVVPR